MEKEEEAECFVLVLACVSGMMFVDVVLCVCARPLAGAGNMRRAQRLNFAILTFNVRRNVLELAHARARELNAHRNALRGAGGMVIKYNANGFDDGRRAAGRIEQRVRNGVRCVVYTNVFFYAYL